MIDFDIYQRQANRTAKKGPDLNYNLNHAALGLAGEAGEFVDAVKKSVIYGKPLDVANLREEMGDLLWYIALACDALGVTMQDIAQENVNKLKRRYPDAYSDELAGARLDKA